MRIFAFIYFVFFSLVARSQNATIDSLQKTLKTQKEDTNKVNTLNLLCVEYRNIGEYPRGLQCGNQALALATIISNSPLAIKQSEIKQAALKGEAKAYNNIGTIYRNQSDYSKALEMHFKSAKIYEASGEKKGMAGCYGNIGLIYDDQSDYSNALKLYFKSLKIFEDLGDKQGMSKCYNNIGLIYDNQSDYPKALEYYFKSLKIKEILDDKKGMSSSYNNIGIIYHEQADIPKALEYYFKSLKISEASGDKKSMSFSCNNIGNIYREQSDYPEALEYYFKGLHIAEELGDKQAMSGCYNVLGELYVRFFEKDSARLGLNLLNNSSIPGKTGISQERGMPSNELHISHFALLDSALVLQKKALSINKALGDIYRRIYSLSGIGDVFLHQQKFPEAIDWFQQSYSAADSVKALKEKMLGAKNISDCYKKLKEFDKAFSWHETFTQLKDSVFNQEKTKELTKKAMNYEFDKKELLAKAAQDKKDVIVSDEIKKQTIVRNFSVAGILVVLSAGVYGIYHVRKRKRLESLQALSNERLRISRELHDDIGSTLGSIAVYSDVAKNRSLKNENPNDVLLKIGIASRELIEKMSDIVWSLNPENETFEQLQNRMQAFAAMTLTPRNIMSEFKKDNELKTLQLNSEQRKNIFLIYKEAIHNIIKYADCKNVFISFTKSINNFTIIIKDDGKGFDANHTIAYNGNGLKNMKSRAGDMKASISINSKKNAGTVVEMTLTV